MPALGRHRRDAHRGLRPSIGQPSGQTSGRRSSSARRSAASRARDVARVGRRAGRRAGSRRVAGRQRPPANRRSARSAARYVHGETRSKKNVTRGVAARGPPAPASRRTAAGGPPRPALRQGDDVAHRPLERSAGPDLAVRDSDRGVRSSTTNRKMLARPPDDSSNVRSGERRQPFPLAQIGGSPSPPYLPRSAIPTTSGRPTPAPSISSATSGPCSSCATSPAAPAGSSSSSACCRASRPSSCARG